MVKLRRELTARDQILFGMAGAIGTGILFSPIGMAAVAGPGVIVAWLIGAIFYTFIGLTLVELSMEFPEAGGPSRYSLYSHGKATNMLNAFGDVFWYLFIPPIEALATVEGLNYFYPHFLNAHGNPTTLGALGAVVMMLLFLPLNYYGIKVMQQANRYVGLIKLVLLAVVGLAFLTIGHFGNLSHYGGFAPFGVTGILAAVPLGMFAFGGIRVIPDYAEETTSPEALGRSILWTILGQTILYLLFATAFVVALSWSHVHLATGDWAGLDKLPGNPFVVIASHPVIAWLLVLTLIVAVLSPFVTGYIDQGSGARVVLAMARSGLVPARFKELNQRYAVPTWAILAFTVVGVVIAFLFAPVPSIYALTNDAVVAGYLGFAANPVAMLALRRQGRKGFFRRPALVANLGFMGAALIVYWSGWPSVPYSAILVALASIIFGIIYKVTEFKNAWWYIAYMAFLVLMTYIGSVGALKLINFYLGSAIVVVVSLAVFLPWGVASRLSNEDSETLQAQFAQDA
ncbi:APC family permease [Sulfobacillus harzensis]|uniref:APC family permease n=1 Tax=Sulfobacillus harzensis TaxID=2729629 RepID=A0A7Y0L175_9FIRM|nr:APC family permease [Sulfobacillus harzensis]NMP21419.1 APC family permease [Sulfobacillus harzensis]